MTIDPATLRLRYPAFTAVDDAVITYWLTDAGRIVTEAWGADYEPATFALAAHSMVLAGAAGIATGATSEIPAGVTRFRSGSMDVGISEKAANRLADGGYQATSYGQEFAVMLRRNCGAPRLVGCFDPCLPC